MPPGSNCSSSRRAEQTNFALLATAGIDPRTGRLFLRVTGDPDSVRPRKHANTRIRSCACWRQSYAHPSGSSTTAAAELSSLATSRNSSPSRLRPTRRHCAGRRHPTWTYAELDGSADRIAAGLLAAGMPPGARIGVMLDRSPELIATVLGVLKAGAAVVPLDVSYPQARIDAMIERAEAFPRHLRHRRGPRH